MEELDTHPLCLVLLPALGNGDGVLEDAIVSPESHLLQAGSASEEVEDGADESLLVVGKIHARRGLDVGTLELEVACSHT